MNSGSKPNREGPVPQAFPRDAPRDSASVVRIKPIMRISKWMNIPHRPGHLSPGHVENPLNCEAPPDSPHGSHLYPPIAALIDERGEPVDFQLEVRPRSQDPHCAASTKSWAWPRRSEGPDSPWRLTPLKSYLRRLRARWRRGPRWRSSR